tara:strand:- start:193 stop:306 length:114 start_codon:yes stop_codon:yes gene_type:complete
MYEELAEINQGIKKSFIGVCGITGYRLGTEEIKQDLN